MVTKSNRREYNFETLSLGNTFQLCKVRSFYVIDRTNWMNLFNTRVQLVWRGWLLSGIRRMNAGGDSKDEGVTRSHPALKVYWLHRPMLLWNVLDETSILETIRETQTSRIGSELQCSTNFDDLECPWMTLTQGRRSHRSWEVMTPPHFSRQRGRGDIIWE